MLSHVHSPLADLRPRPRGVHAADWIGDVDGWPSRRPSLAYQWALDVSASEIHRQQCPIVLIAAHPVLGPEAARRLGVAWDTPSRASARTDELAALVPAPLGSGVDDASFRSGPATVLWVEPTARDWHQTIVGVEQVLGWGGSLLVLTSSPWLARSLPEWGASVAPAHGAPLGGWAVVRRLRAAHWSVDTAIGFRGLRSLSLGALERLGAMARLDALADRLSVRMRERFAERGRFARLSTVTLVGARPPAGQLGTRGGARCS